MSSSPVRPVRRIASRRRVVVDEENGSDVENTVASRAPENDEEDFTTAPARGARASPRRKTTGNAVSAISPGKRGNGVRRARTGESVDMSALEPSQMFSPPPESVADDQPPSPTRPSPPKRRSVKDARAARKSRAPRVSIAPDPPQLEHSHLPTPEATASPEPVPTPASRQGTPLTDITETAINERTPTLAQRHVTLQEDAAVEGAENARTPKAEVNMEVKRIDPSVSKLERPLDIVVRKKALGIPLSQEPAVRNARMTITYLILTNFKSYAGRQVVGPFHASFSSVVGPNGSGKSNVIDSLLFVFGFRASKMRQGKISALIHNSARYPDLDFCEVEVHFQEVMDLPGGGAEVVPESKLVISRRAFKNNSSNYYIDGRKSDFTTVTTLLKDRGVDLDHKRFLILQGEVESIAQMKPKAQGEHDDGLLEYLEDIIGTSRFKTPIEEAAAKTEELNEVCLEKQSRVRHVEKEKNGLEEKKNKAVSFINDENDLALKQSALYQIYIAECGDNIAVTEEAVGQTQAELDQELQRHGGSEDEVNKLERRYRAGAKEYEKLEGSAQAILTEVAKLDKETVKFVEKEKFLANKRKKLEKSVEGAKMGVHEAETLGKQAEEDLTRLTGEIDTLEAEMADEEQELARVRESLKGKTQGLSDQIAAKQRQLEPWNAKISEKQSAMAVAQSELDILRERENAGATAVAELEAKIATLTEQRDAKAAQLQECAQGRRRSEREIATVRKQVEQLAAREVSLKVQLTSFRAKADEARASLSATQSQGVVLTGLTRLRDSGRIDGFHGRLGNLASIDARYDVAISTACPSLDNLVVDSVEVGQQCIEYLRKNNLGRANFICLDRLPQRDLGGVGTPENVPRLFDLVKSKEERFKPAFYSVLQNTLVAKDLEQANRIAYGAKRWRVVTLEGQLIDKSGTMSGGGTRVAKGGMSSKLTADVTKEQVAKMEVDRDALENEYAELLEQTGELEAQIKEGEASVPELETTAQKFALEVESLERNIADAEKRVKELSADAKSSKTDTAKVAGLEKTIAKLEAEIKKLQAETAGIEEEIRALQDQIMEVGGVKLRLQKVKVDGLKEQIESLNERLSESETSKAKAEKQRTKYEHALVEAEKDMEKVAVDVGKVEAERKTQGAETAGCRRKAEEAEQELEEKREALAEVKAELDRLVAELNETRGVEVEMRNRLEENKKILLDNQKRLAYWQEKLGKLTILNITDDNGSSEEEKTAEPVPELSRDELADLNKNDLKAAIAALEERLAKSASVDLAVLTEYRRRCHEHATRLSDLQSALTARDAAKRHADDLRRARLEGFMEGFSIISLRLKEMYQMITMGGNAELELVDSLDPFAEGILFSVMPPKKSWKNIGNLSGGEKTLSSLALVFALHHYRPTPLYVMDEIDAALDFRNVSIVAAYIKERTKNAQFIVISLRNNMFELASRLVGVYKVNHMVSSLARLNPSLMTLSLTL
ncbi:hypothetical protein BAUCODRAFT_30568 [Baudoinia panamericana UAMH 10762]|uniref:Structural maintenance of chromosomes protein n=1 Tax=Baudoinia panamericana (strain UAMH 10762) TaxID=717646 RepID=M2NKX3_BAUPA|nr:uncharacterized protein BAUCODRAFT_30568 [Baudoinia panamericana UAMH 10762]EMD00110.1 hypothetical protein BAUCODRAFT_30568 [Baudoinia panamericana UAMH 10762]